MTVPRDPDLIVGAWLDEGPTHLPDQTRRAIAVTTRTTEQRRRTDWPPRRNPLMSSVSRVAIAAVVVLALVGGAAYLLRPSSGVGAGVPTPSPTTMPSTQPSASAFATFDTATWVADTSTRYGYAISRPSDWTTDPAHRDWSMAVDQHDWLSTAADQFKSPGTSFLFTVFAAPIPAGMSDADWLASYAAPDPSPSAGTPCSPTPVAVDPVSVDGHTATFAREPNRAGCGGFYAFVPVGDRMYVFTVWRNGSDALLRAFLSTVHFLP